MATKEGPKRIKKKGSRKSSEMRKQGEKKLGKIGDIDLNHWPKDAQRLLQELRAHQIDLEMQNEQLREAQKRHEHLASFPGINPNPVVAVNLEGTVQYLNPAANKLFPGLQSMGARHEWLVDLKSIGTLLKDKKKTAYVREIRIDSAWFEQVFFLTPMQDQIRVYGIDISERKQAEESFKAACVEAENERHRLEAVMEALPVGLAITDAQGGNIRSNNAYEQIWGSPRPAALSVSDYAAYKAWWSETGKPVAPEDWASAQAVQKGKAVVGQLLEIKRFDGSRVSVINSGAPIFDTNGKIVGCAVAIQDITGLRKAEQALLESEFRYRSLFNNMISGFAYHKVLCDDQGKPIDYVFLEVNDAFEKLTGLRRENIIGKRVTQVLSGVENELADWIGIYGEVARTGESIRLDSCSEALKKWYSVSAYSPEKGYFATVFEDITERKRIEDELRRSHEELEIRVQERTAELAKSNQALQFEIEERKQVEEARRQSEMKYRIVADNTYDWEWWRDPEGVFIYVSPSCKRVTHHEAEEFIKDPDLLLKIIHPDDKSSFITHRIEVEEKHTSGEMEFRIVSPDGSMRWIGHACQPVFDEQGRFLGRRGSNRDITERKCAEEALRESEEQLRYLSSKLLTAQETERRRISRELHDELGGALAALKLRSNFIKKNLQKDQTDLKDECESNEKYIDQIIENVHRLSWDLSPPVLEDLGLLSALRWLIDHFVKHYDIKVNIDNIDVDHQFSREAEIMIFRIFQEAFTNIGKHAQAKNVSVIIKKDVDRLSFLLEDDGKGFDPNTVHMGEATERGMGLATMRERARLLGGSFDLQSHEGKGTLITIRVPIKTKDGEGL